MDYDSDEELQQLIRARAEKEKKGECSQIHQNARITGIPFSGIERAIDYYSAAGIQLATRGDTSSLVWTLLHVAPKAPSHVPCWHRCLCHHRQP